jgi:hypothetical protein
MSETAPETLTFGQKWIPTAGAAADVIINELPAMVIQLPGTLSQMVDAAGEIVLPRQADREAGA